MNTPDILIPIQQLAIFFDLFCKSFRGNGYRKGQRHIKRIQRLNVRNKMSVCNEQVCYAFQNALQDLKSKPFSPVMTVIVIAIFLTLPNMFYMVYKNVNQVALQHYLSPKITVYLDKALNNNAVKQVIEKIQIEKGVERVNYLSREEALGEFHNWFGFSDALDILEENPLPAVLIVIPRLNFQRTDLLNTLRERIAHINGIDEVRMDDDWFFHLGSLTCIAGRVLAMIGILMIVTVFVVISNSVHLSIFARYDAISVQKLIGATDAFILRPFLYRGALLGFGGAFLSLIFSEILLVKISLALTEVVRAFEVNFHISGFSADEWLLLLLLCSMIGWVAAWRATIQYLRHFAPD